MFRFGGRMKAHGLFKHLGTTWRSIVSVILTYVIVVVLFFYQEHWLNVLVQWASGVHDWLAHSFGLVSERGQSVFTLAISDATVFVTLMILFVRVVVLSIILWFTGKLVNWIWPSRRA